MSMKIGNVEIESPCILAPMAGVTDLPFRLLCREQGAGLLSMEMVSAKAVSFHNKNTEALMEIAEGKTLSPCSSLGQIRILWQRQLGR